MSKSQRTKGHRGELEVVHHWKDTFPKAHRHLEFQASEAEKGIDVILTDEMGVQVKIGKQVPKKVYDFIEQIQGEEGEFNWVECRRDGKGWLAVLRWEDFKKLLLQAIE